jgi:hypothetical protein
LLTFRAAFYDVAVEGSDDEEQSNGTEEDSFVKTKKPPATPPRGTINAVPQTPPKVITSTNQQDEFEISLGYKF